MLTPPHRRYDRLFVYHLTLPTMPVINDQDYIGGWLEDGSAILFFHRNRDEEIRLLCAREKCEVIYQADMSFEDWEAGLAVSSFSCGGMTFAPVWEECGADIIIDPSVVFGSGFHPSTRLALEAMLDLIGHTGVRTMLDLGCGTGILTIAAARSGVEKVVAMDNNPLACRVAEKNAAANNAAIEVHRVDLREEVPDSAPFDLVVANLYHALLLDLFKDKKFWRARYYLLAGFIPAMEEDLMAALPRPTPRFIDRRRRDRWCLWLLENNQGSQSP